MGMATFMPLRCLSQNLDTWFLCGVAIEVSQAVMKRGCWMLLLEIADS